MPVQTTHCPDKTTLIDYLLGRLPNDLQESCETHFADCLDCEETIRGLNATDTLSQLAAEVVSDNAVHEATDKNAVSNLINQLQNGAELTRPASLLDDRAAEVGRLLEPIDNDQAIGRLAHYRIEQLIGAGSTGVVYRAVDEQLDREVALKVLRPSLGQAARERFMAEARAAAAIDHANVITIYHVGVVGPLAYMAMQWLPGETLEDRLNRVTFLSEHVIKQIGSEIASGLQAAHSKNLIHRDIKPANIWMRDDTGEAIILDFGLARIADDDPQLTNTGMLAGTPNFMSPEQTRGLELDGRSDLFSLGCLMYRAATGKLPFGSTGILATLQAIQNDRPDAPKELNPALSLDFSDLTMCLLEKQPVNRPEDAEQLINALNLPRSKWEFSAASAASPTPPAKTASTLGAQYQFTWWRWVATILLIGMLGSFAYLFAPDVIRVVTDQGELVIEPFDPDVRIEILSNGQVVEIIDTKTKQKLNIKSGEYSLRVQDDRNAFELSPKKVVMTRGGREIVKVTRIDTKSLASSGKPGSNRNPLETSSPTANADRDANMDLTRYIPGPDWKSAILQAELDVKNARNALQSAQETLEESKNLASRGIKTQSQIRKNEYAVEASQTRLMKAEQALSTAILNQQNTLERQKVLDDLINQKLKILKQTWDIAETRYRQGAMSRMEMEKAKLQYIDAQLNLLQGGSILTQDPSKSDQLPPAKARLDSGSSQPTFEGRTFDQWSTIVKTERSSETVRMALRALGELSSGDPALQETALKIVTPMIRQRGSLIIGGFEGELTQAFTLFLSRLPHERLLKFFLDELETGTRQSRGQLTWLLVPESLYENRPNEEAKAYEAFLEENFHKLFPAVVHYVERAPRPERTLAIMHLNELLSHSKNHIDLLKSTMNSSNHPDVTGTLAVSLVNEKTASNDAMRLIEQTLFAPDLDDEVWRRAYYSLRKVAPPGSKVAIQALMRIFDDDKLCRRLVDHYESYSQKTTLRNVRTEILRTIVGYGADAQPALGWLEELQNNNPEFEKLASDCIDDIVQKREGSAKR